MLATEFLVRGAVEFGEPGVFMMFEENAARSRRRVSMDVAIQDGVVAAAKDTSLKLHRWITSEGDTQ